MILQNIIKIIFKKKNDCSLITKDMCYVMN